MFTDKEIAYLNGQRIGRLATAGADGAPHNVPVGVHYNAELDTIDIGGFALAGSRKYRDVLANPKVAFVVDDVVAFDPWVARGIEIRGLATAYAEGGRAAGFPAEELIRIVPTRIVSWGIEAHWQTGFHSRRVPAQAAGRDADPHIQHRDGHGEAEARGEDREGARHA
ncbi:PPOX class F420-dependent oxidoreductase [Spongiactinospora rosea]|uniref:PPOX class F420-dependent oxidoreductase n=1 Tax=Spongiactinospora rosea TaxID=2248750 RepID=A0A366M4L4_9ACTN|nr:PPOX class F420-dependent oxidoreductase [Spongiactinospora rosea]